jgi:4-amino-4-deoxy-L-arabinose transferase-like glycosyltransferase
LLALNLGNDNYNSLSLQGRALSALSDFLVILIIYQLGYLWEKRYHLSPWIKIFGSFFYAIAVLPIQLAHFFAVDSFLNLFMLLSVYFAIKNYSSFAFQKIIVSGVFFALALACKITAVFILPLIGYFLLVRNPHRKKKSNFFLLLSSLAVFILTSYLVFRLVDPYKFANTNWFDLRLNSHYLENLKVLKSYDNPNVWYPPGVQWISKPPVIFALKNLSFYGLGIPYFLLVIVGVVFIVKSKFKSLKVLTLWLGLFFIFQSAQYVQSMRYFIFIYPFLAILAAFGFIQLGLAMRKITPPFLNNVFLSVILLAVLVWPLMFFSIYTKPHSRVTASAWIYSHIKPGALILGEYWDDALPLVWGNYHPELYQNISLPVFDPDDQTKWQKMNFYLARGDYYILSSNRGWASIIAVPEKYPLMSKFYQELFTGRTNYVKIKEFTSYPSLKYLGIPWEINTDTAEEAFTVYDHPKVMIYQRRQ